MQDTPKRISYSQLGQDVYVMDFLNNKKNGYFVEIGVGTGKLISNTYLMEKHYEWTGLLCEANIYNVRSIQEIRSAPVECCPIWSSTGEDLVFFNCEIQDLSGVEQCFNENVARRKLQNKITLKSISLNDALEKHHAPKEIDYISIDTEGSEYEIIKAFDFNKYKVSIWSVEHNTPWRNDGIEYLNSIRSIMESNGYVFVPNEFDCYFYKPESVGL